jgi:triphosphoribosyl-dephospho-CoA synthase
MRRTTPDDAIGVYKAIQQVSPGGMGRTAELDVDDSASIAEIRERKLSLLDIFRISAGYDRIAWEWVNDFSITFEIGLPSLIRELESTGDINVAIVDTYLKILSRIPDTLITRKQGIKTAEKVSSRARKVLKVGGLKTLKGRGAVMQMDDELQRSGNGFNPGTTADFTASALSVLILSGYRP